MLAPIRAGHGGDVFRSIGLPQGLTDERVFVIRQDPLGFMWFGTMDGLNRFDGHRMRQYRHDASDPRSISANSIVYMYVDRAGELWIAAGDGGLNRYDRATDSFVRYVHDPDDPTSLPGNTVWGIFEDSAGLLWIATKDGFGHLDRRTGAFTRLATDEAIDRPWDFLEDDQGTVWIASASGLGRYDRGTRAVTCIRHDPDDPGSLGPGRVLDMVQDASGALWVGTGEGGVARLDPSSGRLDRFGHEPGNPASLHDDRGRRLLVDSRDRLWIGTDTGFCVLDLATGVVERIPRDEAFEDRFGAGQAIGLLEDSNGTIWGATFSALYRFDPERRHFVQARHAPEDPWSLSNDGVRELIEDDDGVVWVGTVGGANALLSSGRMFETRTKDLRLASGRRDARVHLLHEDAAGNLWIEMAAHTMLHRAAGTGRLTRVDLPRDGSSAPDTWQVNAIHEDADGILWLGTSMGMARFDPAKRDLDVYTAGPLDGNGNRIARLHPDGVDALWLATAGGLRRFDLTERAYTPYAWDPANDPSAKGNVTRAVHVDHEGTVWVGGWNALHAYDPETGRARRYAYDPLEVDGLGSGGVRDIHEDANGMLWLGTPTGLSRFDRATGTTRTFTTAEGLSHDSVRRIIEDERGHLWLAARFGLSVFDPETERAHRLGIGDGLEIGSIAAGAFVRSRSGMIWLGGQEGLATLDPAGAVAPARPRIMITGLALSHRPLAIGDDSPLQRSILETDEITLSYRDRVVTFEFAALSFRDPAAHRYRYRLEGRDDQWFEADAGDPSATYTSLPSGHYTFRVQGADHRGVWNEQGDAIALTITPPWWNTTWFRAVCILAVVGLVVGGHRVRTASIRRHNTRLEGEIRARNAAQSELMALSQRMITAQEDDRARIARELHDDVNQRLAALSIDLGMSRQQAAGANVDQLAAYQEQVQQISDSIRHASHELHPAMLERLGLSGALRSLCREFESQHDVIVELDVPEHVELRPEVARCLYRIAQEAMQNVARHARAKSVRVTLDAGARLTVADDGVGIAGDAPMDGLGLASMTERARLLGGTVRVQQAPGGGTEVIAEVP